MKKTVSRKNFISPYFSATLPAALLVQPIIYASTGNGSKKQLPSITMPHNQSTTGPTRSVTHNCEEKLLFSVNKDDEREYQVFVFDLHSKLVSQSSLCGKGKINLPDLPPGTCVQVFTRMETGTMLGQYLSVKKV